jgi:tetratricopeptide (TPR) repeat protein
MKHFPRTCNKTSSFHREGAKNAKKNLVLSGTIRFILIAGFGFLAANHVGAQFLDFSQPARATALGGNLVALPEGSSALAFNPAGLSLQKRFEVDARYESLFPGLENDTLSTGNITALTDPMPFGVVAGSWDHLGSNLLEQDRLQLGWGKEMPVGGFIQSVGGGFSLSYLSQRYSLSTPLPGVPLSGLSSSAFSLGGGVLLNLPSGFTVGFSAADITQPNLGIVGIDQVPMVLRWGLAADLFRTNPVRWILTASQSLTGTTLNSSGGMELYFPNYGMRIRGGMGPYQGAVGLGYEMEGFFLDYSYSFSIAGFSEISNAGLPGSNLFELGYRWGDMPVQAAYNEYFRKAQDSESQGRWEKANWYYLECFSMKPSAEAAEGHNRVLAKYNRDRGEECYMTGQTAEKQGLLVEARYDYELAVKLSPDSAEYSQALARMIMAAERMSIDKEIAGTIRQVADLLDKRDMKTAGQVVAQALRKHPDNAALKLIQGSLGEDYNAGTPGGPGGAETQKAKETAKLATTEADLYLSHGRADLAKDDLEKTLAAQPQNMEIKRKLAALEVPTPVVSPENQELAEGLYEKGLKSYLEGDLTGAIKDWEQALQADPTDTRVQNDLVRAKIEEKVEHP